MPLPEHPSRPTCLAPCDGDGLSPGASGMTQGRVTRAATTSTISQQLGHGRPCAGHKHSGHHSAGSRSHSPCPSAQRGHSNITQTREQDVPWKQPFQVLLAVPSAPHQLPLPLNVPCPRQSCATQLCPTTLRAPKRIVQSSGRRGQTQTQLRALREPGRIPHTARGPQQHPQAGETPRAQPWHPWTHLPTAPGSLCHPLPGTGLL